MISSFPLVKTCSNKHENTHQHTAEPFKNSSAEPVREVPSKRHHRDRSHIQTIGKNPQVTALRLRWYLHTLQLSLLPFKFDSVPPFLSVYLCRFLHGVGTHLPIQPVYSITTSNYTTDEKQLSSRTCGKVVQYPHGDEDCASYLLVI